MREPYQAEVLMADAQAGQVVDALAQRALLDDTLVIITADHGENIGDHGMIDHMLSMYETTLRIPLIVRYPERFEAGRVSDDLVNLIDIVPTVLDVCNLVEESAASDTASLSLCAPERPDRRFLMAENDRPVNGVSLLKKSYPHVDTKPIDRRMRAIWGERYKLIWREGLNSELFDLESDPAETRNIAAIRPDILDALRKQLGDWMAAVGPEGGAESFESQDEESLRMLRSLGYLE